MKDFGFIILRCVLSKEQDEYWYNCYRSIKINYPNINIVIIDDNSLKIFLENDNRINDSLVTIINSEFSKGRGEILPYYYLYKNKFFKKGVILHDSTFINKYFDFSKHDNKFLYYFNKHQYDQSELEITMIKLLQNNEMLLNVYKNIKLWNGCFGVMSVINIEFLNYIEDKYNLFNLLNFIDSRIKRMALERILGVIFFIEKKESIKNCSLFGNVYCIPRAFSLDMNGYRSNIQLYRRFNIVKYWCKR